MIQSFTATPAALYEGETSTLAWEIDAGEVSGALLVELLAPGGGVVHSTAEASGSFPLVIGDTGGNPQTWTYTLRASESGGAMISRQQSVDIAVDPGIPTAAAQSLSTVGPTPLAITLGASDPNQFPNPTLAFTVVTPPGGGSLSGTAPGLTYTANAGFTGTDSLVFKVNDGKYDSPLTTVTIEVLPQPLPPTGIALSTTNIGENVVSGGFVATLSSSDVNPGDTHTYSLVAGAGSTDNALFSIVGNQLRAATSFAGLVGSSYSIRLRSLDSSGLSYQQSFVLAVVAVSDAVVINEIHYNPPENPVRQEFIELHNPSDTVADLSGWRLSSAVGFVFPEGTSIPAGGYLVIAEDPGHSPGDAQRDCPRPVLRRTQRRRRDRAPARCERSDCRRGRLQGWLPLAGRIRWRRGVDRVDPPIARQLSRQLVARVDPPGATRSGDAAAVRGFWLELAPGQHRGVRSGRRLAPARLHRGRQLEPEYPDTDRLRSGQRHHHEHHHRRHAEQL